MLGNVSTNSIFRGKLSTFNFQLSLPSYGSTGRPENGKALEEVVFGAGDWWRWAGGGVVEGGGVVKFDGSSASILNAESSVGQLLYATLC